MTELFSWLKIRIFIKSLVCFMLNLLKSRTFLSSPKNRYRPYPWRSLRCVDRLIPSLSPFRCATVFLLTHPSHFLFQLLPFSSSVFACSFPLLTLRFSALRIFPNRSEIALCLKLAQRNKEATENRLELFLDERFLLTHPPLTHALYLHQAQRILSFSSK